MPRLPIIAALVFSFLPAAALAQSAPRYLPLGPADAALYTPDTGSAPHRTSACWSYTERLTICGHSACTELSRRGFMVLCMNTRFTNNEMLVRFEELALDVKAGVQLLRAQPGITKVVLCGKSHYSADLQKSWWSQWVDATLACSLLAGVSKPKIFRGRLFKRSATLSSSCLGVDRQVGSFWEVLSQQPIRVFVRAALPGALRITEVHFHIRSHCEALVLGQLEPAIPRQRAPQRCGESTTCRLSAATTAAVSLLRTLTSAVNRE